MEETTFAAEKVKERQDLQRLIRNDVTILGADLKVVAEDSADALDEDHRDLRREDIQGEIY